jgi:uncharacterized protein YutE (UPF0331/DUF86 family)
MRESPRKSEEKQTLTSESVSSSKTETAALRTHLPLDVKLNLLEKRLLSLDGFERLPFEEFRDSLPGLERLLPLLAQSSVDICYSLLLDKAGAVPRSYYDLIDTCEKKGILPTGLVRRLCRQLILIDTGFRLDQDELAQMHRGMGETRRVFHQLLEHVKGVLAARSSASS